MEKNFIFPVGCCNRLACLFIILLFPPLLLAQAPNPQENADREKIFAQISDADSVTASFYAALERLRFPSSINEKILARLYSDVVDIVSDAERARWKAARTPNKKVDFIKRFWLGHDLTPATTINERLVEHYTRLRQARDKFSYFDQRGYDDRGMIYIQYGPPDDHVDSPINDGAIPTLSWVYYRHGAPVNFDFINEGFGYRLNSHLTEATRTFSAVTELLAIKDLLEPRITLHPTYAQFYMDVDIMVAEVLGDLGDPQKSKYVQIKAHQSVDRIVNAYMAESSQRQAQLPKSLSEVLTKINALPCVLNLAKFESEGHKLDLVASYGFNPADLKGKADTLQLQIVAAVRDSTLDLCASRDTTYEFMRRSPQNSEAFVAAAMYSLPPSKYYFLLDVNNPQGNQRGLRDFTVGLGPYPKEVLHLSTAIFATQVVPASDSLVTRQPLQRQNLAISPYPFATIKRNARLFVYFEIYDLKRDESGETFYEVEYEVNAPEKKGLSSLLASLNPFSKSRGSISVTDTRRGKATMEPTYLQLDFSQLRGGNYNLVVRVTDKIANITKENKLQFELE
jgi:GWxTD domain-containing protein